MPERARIPIHIFDPTRTHVDLCGDPDTEGGEGRVHVKDPLGLLVSDLCRVCLVRYLLPQSAYLRRLYS